MTRHPAFAGLPIVFGGNVLGWTADRDESFRLLDGFYEAGGRMIDTAEGYSAWVPGHSGGESETVLGEWLDSRGVRSDMRIATKTAMDDKPASVQPDAVSAALDKSLERLRTDYVDLYYLHRDHDDVACEDIVASFAATVRDGRVRSLGISNVGVDRLTGLLNAAEKAGATPFSAVQNACNLVSTNEFGEELRAICQARGLLGLPFGALAGGFLTGKYRDDDDGRDTMRGANAVKRLETGRPVLAALDAVAAETGAAHATIAIAWVLAQPGVDAPLASASKVDQLPALIAAATLTLTDSQRTLLDAASL